MLLKNGSSNHPQQYNRFVFTIISHYSALKNSLEQIIKKPLSYAMTTLIIAITLSLPTILYIFIYNFQTITTRWHTEPTLSIYLKKEAPQNKVSALINQLKSLNGVTKVTYVSPEQGLKDLENFSEISTVIPLLNNNPLPGVINLTMSHLNNDTSSVTTLLQSLQTSLIIDNSQLDFSQLQRTNFILIISKRILLTLTLFLSVGIVLSISNTIRLTTQVHHAEMQILKLVGATNNYIRRPYLYHGLLCGFLGGVLAFVFAIIISSWITLPVLSLVKTYGLHFQPCQNLTMVGISLLIVAVGLSLTGAWLATKQLLDKEVSEPPGS